MYRIKIVSFQVFRQLTRLGGAGWFGWVFERLSNWLPVRGLRSSERLIIISHPRPSYPFHALLIPKQAISGLQELQASHSDLLLEIFQTAARLAGDYGLENYRIVVNGGAYQDVPQLHFHLISDERPGLLQTTRG